MCLPCCEILARGLGLIAQGVAGIIVHLLQSSIVRCFRAQCNLVTPLATTKSISAHCLNGPQLNCSSSLEGQVLKEQFQAATTIYTRYHSFAVMPLD